MIIDLKKLKQGKCRIFKTKEFINAERIAVLYTKDIVIIKRVE